jgi:chromosome segregation ATPase
VSINIGDANPYYAFLALLRSQDEMQRALARIEHNQATMATAIARIELKEKTIMALTQAEQDAITALTAKITEIGSDVDAVVEAVKGNLSSLQGQVVALTELRDQLQANDAADAAQIAALSETITALRDAAASSESEVLDALRGLGGHLDDLDTHVEELTPPSPPTPPAP